MRQPDEQAAPPAAADAPAADVPAADAPAADVPAAYLRPLTEGADLAAETGAVGRTMFDTPGAEDGSVTVLLPKEEIAQVPLQSLVRICSSSDGRDYLGIVVSGPFAEPDGLRADANVIVTTTVNRGIFMPRYHGRVRVEILGQEIDGELVPPRFRPLPNSPVYVLDAADKTRALRASGRLRIGRVLGDEEVEIGVPPDRKSVLPRHLAVLGTTGAGKSTTIGGLIWQAQRAGMAVVLLDTEGEYTHMGEPADDPHMTRALAALGMEPSGVDNTWLYHLTGTETANPGHPRRQEFGLAFESLSPYTVAEILDLSDAQHERFLRATDAAKLVLRDAGIFPRPDAEQRREDERRVLELNEFDEGYPFLTLARLMDVVRGFIADVEHDHQSFRPSCPEFRGEAVRSALLGRAHAARSSHPVSWRTLLARLWQLERYQIFDQPGRPAVDHRELLRRGRVTLIDLSGADSPQLCNIVISGILRGVQRRQDEAYQLWESSGRRDVEPVRVLVVIEEAHEFLAASRISRMPVLFEQVSRIAKRGRKRWIGLVFVTQLPQHLPREVLGLVNNQILHKISDEAEIRSLRRVIPGIDEGLWRRLPALAPGQAIVSFTHMTRPLLASVDPAPCRLRMID